MADPVIFECPGCNHVSLINCDDCQGIVVWDDDENDTCHCTGCGRSIGYYTCSECSRETSIYRR
jgi:transcription elongation factor Elf1